MKLPANLLEALFETIPLELTVIDGDDAIVGWNTRAPRIFDRRPEVLGSDVRRCHSEKGIPLLERLLAEMKSGARETARFWYDRKDGAAGKVLVEYFAVRDGAGRYLGCVEAVRMIDDPGRFAGEKRTLEEGEPPAAGGKDT